MLPPSKGRDLSKEAQDLVSKLLVKEPTERLGCMKLGVAEIKRHAFFAKTNWQRLEKKLTDLRAGLRVAEIYGRAEHKYVEGAVEAVRE